MHKNITGRLSIVLTICLLFVTCTGFDDKSLPPDAGKHIYFQEFEISPKRNYILGRIINNSPYTLTSCQIEIKIYQEGAPSDRALSLKEGKLKNVSLSGLTPILSERMFMRETLEPGYSTEIYFELSLHELQGEAIFTREIIEFKGRTPL